ncbi:MAG: oligosaccharide flippase family protein [Alistipes sp.]
MSDPNDKLVMAPGAVRNSRLRRPVSLSIVMARLLTPADFGVVGMITIFPPSRPSSSTAGSPSRSFARRMRRTPTFVGLHFNILLSLLFAACSISPLPSPVLRHADPVPRDAHHGLTVIISSLTIVQRARVTEIRFNIHARCHVSRDLRNAGIAAAYADSDPGPSCCS